MKVVVGKPSRPTPELYSKVQTIVLNPKWNIPTKIAKKDIIPKAILTKEPSAELRPDQKDTDSLPPYEELDRILKLYIEDDLSVKEIIKSGENKELTEKIIRMVDKNEYKRRQSPPGIKITTKAFGKDRRMPITSRYK